MRNFDLANHVVYGGMWNTVEVLLAGIWWMGLGLELRKEQRNFGAATVILGTASLADGIGNIAGIPALAEIGLNIYLLLGIIWPVWLGVQLISKNTKTSHITIAANREIMVRAASLA